MLTHVKQEANALLAANRLAEAIATLKEATRHHPQDAEAWCMLGAAFGLAGEHAAAISACRQAIEYKPDYPEAWCNLGASQHDLRQLDAAIASLSEAVRLKPDYVAALYNLGNSLRDTARLREAIDCYQRVLQLQPVAEAWLNLGLVHERTADLALAVASYREALKMNPLLAEAHNNLANVLVVTGDYATAQSHYQRALEIRPSYADAHNNLALLYVMQNRIRDAVEHYRQALQLRPDFADAWNNLGTAELRRGHVADAQAAFRAARRTDPHHAAAQSNWLYALGFDPRQAPQAIFREHERWGEYFAARHSRCQLANSPDPDRSLRVGYLSPDFRTHAITHFIAPVLGAHNQAKIDVFCYADVKHTDAVTARLRALAPHWSDVAGLSDDQLTQLILRDNIDILVDMAGHTANNRLVVFARKPAPVQINYLGYTQTIGLPTVDYFITDARADPPGDADKLFVERLVRLPDVFCCYQPPLDAPPVSPPPRDVNGRITFGALHNLAKINGDVLALWATILHELADAVLLLQAPALADEDVRDEYRQRLLALGIPETRVEFVGALSPMEYLELHKRIDIALDAFPWSGHTSLCHTLWMGVPIITLRGANHPARKAASLLQAAGLVELIAESPEHYCHIATALARDGSRLATMRAGMRAQLTSSPLLNAPRYVAHLESAYREMWRRWCESVTHTIAT